MNLAVIFLYTSRVSFGNNARLLKGGQIRNLDVGNRGMENSTPMPNVYSCRAALQRLYLKTSACFG